MGLLNSLLTDDEKSQISSGGGILSGLLTEKEKQSFDPFAPDAFSEYRGIGPEIDTRLTRPYPEDRKPFGEALKHGFSQMGIGLAENIGGIIRSIGEFEPPQGQYYVRPYTKELNKELAEKGKKLAEYARTYREEHPEEIARYKAIEGNFIQRYAGMAKQALTQPELFAQSLLESGPLILEGILGTTVAGPVGGIALMAGGEYGTDYERLRSADVDPQTATGIAAMTSITKAWIEQLTLSRKIGLFNLAKTGKLGPVLYGLSKDFAAGSAEEFTQQITDNLGDILANTKEMSAENLLEGAPEAAGIGGPLEMGMGGAARAGGATLRALAGQTSPETPDTQVITPAEPSKPAEVTLAGVEKITPQKAAQTPLEPKLESEVIKNAEEIRKEAPETGEKAGIEGGEEERLRLRDAEKAGLEAEKGEIAPAEVKQKPAQKGEEKAIVPTTEDKSVSFIRNGKEITVGAGDLQTYLLDELGVKTDVKTIPEGIQIDTLTQQSTNAIRKLLKGKNNVVSAQKIGDTKERLVVLTRVQPTPPQKTEKTEEGGKVHKEIKHEQETVTEPAKSIEVEQGKTKGIVPTGKLNPADPKEAAEIVKLHQNFVKQKGRGDAFSGIFETAWDKEKGASVISSVDYTPEQVDDAYRTVQKPIPSTMPDAAFFAMPGKEKELTAIAAKMQRQKGVSETKKKGARIIKPQGLPKAKTSKEDYIKAIRVATAAESTRYALNGVYVEGENLVATDGRRMFVAKGKWGKDGLYLDNISLSKGKFGKADKKHNFPKWKDIVPKPDKKDAVIVHDLDELFRRVKQAALLINVDSPGVTILVNKDGSLGFASASPEIGHAEINVEPGAKIVGGVNPRFLIDAIRFHAIRGDASIEFYFQEDFARPILTKSLDGKTYTIVMPVTIDEKPSEAIKEATTPLAKKKPKGGGGSGTVGFVGESGEVDTGEIKVSMEPAGKTVSARDIVDFMSRAFGIVVKGKATFNKKALGWFDPHAIGIRMKDVVSITTGTHEIAHHIDWTLNKRLSLNPPTTAIANELMALGKALYGNRKPPGGYKSEGWAEFIREYLTGEEAEKKAPNLHKWFTETYLPDNKDIAKKLAKTKAMIDKWRLQGAEARVDSQINKKDIKGTLSERIERSLLWIETSFRDELAPIKRAMIKAGIKEGELRPDQDPYQIAVGRADKAGAVAMQFVLKYTTDLAGNRTGKGLREILKPVANDINAFTRWIIAARARLLYKKGVNPGISRKDANYVYEKYDNETWQEALKEITAWNHRVLDYLAEAGGIEKDAVNLIKKSNPIYIPFMRAFKEGELRMEGGTGKGIAKVGKPVKKIKGSGREIIDPIESMIKQTHKIISVAHKAEIAKSLAKLSSRKNIASMIWRVPAPKQAVRFEAEQLKRDIAKIAYERMGLDPAEISSGMLEHWDDILTVYSNAGQYYGKDNIVSLVVDGKKNWFEVEPSLYKAIEGIDLYTLPWFWNITAGKATRAVRLGATGLNPSFGLIRNFLRDAMTFTVLSEHAKAGPLSAVKGITEDILDTQSAKKFKAMGGKMSSFILADRQAMQHLRKNVLASSITGKTLYTVAHPVDALRELFGVTEAGTRIGEFSAALEYGEKKWGKNSKAAAIYALNKAQDVTVNFSRHGKIAKSLNQVIPFFNAAIQGVDKIFRTFNQRPVETSLKAILSLTIPAIWLWWKYKDEEWYKNMPEYERVNYLHFEIPGKDVVIRIPVPFELGHIFQSAPVAALDAKYRKDPQIVKDMFAESLKQANPFDWPALIGPAVDILANRDFAGRPIVSQSIENKLPEDQYKEYTTKLMRIIGKTIGYSPAKLEYIVNSYSGGLYSRVSKTAEFASKEKETIPSDIPVVGTLFMRESYAPRSQIEKFYKKRDELNQKYSSKKITSRENALRKKYNQVSDKLSALWKKLPEAKTEIEKKEIYDKMKKYLNYLEGNK